MVGSKNCNHHRNYSFRVVEINGGLREKANRRVENWRECQQATSDGQLIRPSRSLSLVETDDDARGYRIRPVTEPNHRVREFDAGR